MRTLPTTWRLLKRYGAVLYEGHNRIDLGSYPNIMALLTGEETEVGFLFQNLDDLKGQAPRAPGAGHPQGATNLA